MKKEPSNKMLQEEIVLSAKTKHTFESTLKKGIYMELYRRNILSDSQLSRLIKNI